MNRREFPVLIGLFKTDAFKILGEFKISYRISEEDGVHYRMSADINSARINLVIKNGVVEYYKFY